MKTWRDVEREEERGKRRFLDRLAETREANREIEEYDLPKEVEFPENDTTPCARGADR